MFFPDSSLDRTETRSIRFDEASFRALKISSHSDLKASQPKRSFEITHKNVSIPPCPPYYDSSSSFLSNKQSQALFTSIMSILEQRKIDFSHVSAKIDCVCYTESNACCTFTIRVFESPNPRARYLVEVQRRSGCVVAFRRIFHLLLLSFSQNGVALGSPPTSEIPPQPSPEINLDKKTAALMLQTLSEQDTCLEYCRETLCVLSCISKQPRNIALLLEVNPKLPDLLIHFFKSKDVETLRFTASFLSNLLSIRSSHPVVRENLSLLFNAYSSNDLISPGFGRNARTLLHLETKRQITRCLISLTSNNSDIINKNPQISSYTKVLKEATSSHDFQLQRLAEQTLMNFAS